jgi:hypothetical protein
MGHSVNVLRTTKVLQGFEEVAARGQVCGKGGTVRQVHSASGQCQDRSERTGPPGDATAAALRPQADGPSQARPFSIEPARLTGCVSRCGGAEDGRVHRLCGPVSEQGRLVSDGQSETRARKPCRPGARQFARPARPLRRAAWPSTRATPRPTGAVAGGAHPPPQPRQIRHGRFSTIRPCSAPTPTTSRVHFCRAGVGLPSRGLKAEIVTGVEVHVHQRRLRGALPRLGRLSAAASSARASDEPENRSAQPRGEENFGGFRFGR